MEWASHVFKYSALEREILASHHDNALVKEYGKILEIDGLKVFVAVVPSSRPKEIPKLPPIVMIHGLGGHTYSFNFSSEMLHRTCDLILIDLPGHGHSPDPPKGSRCFHPLAIAEILTKVIEKTVDPQLSFILFGHSYGTTHSLRISTGRLKDRCAAVICVAPPYGSTIPQIEKTICKYMPTLVFDSLFRARDRVGGLNSQSVNRMVSPSSGEAPRRHQLYVNLRSRSSSVLLTISEASFFDTSVDKNIPSCPVLIIGAADDKVCPLKKAEKLYTDLKKTEYSKVFLITVPSAGHAVLFERPEFVDAVVTSFLREHVDERLTLSWQLSFLAAKDDKWSLKNETKWKETQPIGAAVGRNVILKGMKVLREGDHEHGPQSFEKLHPDVFAVIDISQDDPPYDPATFERIKYIKFPTVSKIPPTEEEVSKFIELVNQLNARNTEKGAIAVHCHYGYNRTGFFICSYLIAAEGFKVQEALELYAQARPDGIRHQHFIHELYARYT